MRIIASCLCALSLFLGSAAGNALILRTDTTAFASMCCLANGNEITSGRITVLVEVIEAEPGFIGSAVSYGARANSRCNFSGTDVFRRGPLLLQITEEEVSATLTTVISSLGCPFGLRSKSTATLLPPPGVPTFTVESLSECAQPCYDCSGPPFVG